jgi:hypothetical protein
LVLLLDIALGSLNLGCETGGDGVEEFVHDRSWESIGRLE